MRTRTVSTWREALEEARHSGACVRIQRVHDDLLGTDALVAAVGRSWTLLVPIGEDIRRGGWVAVRLSDIAEVAVSPRDDFVRTALSLRGELPLGEIPPVRLDSIRTLLASFSRLSTLITVLTERDGPFACAIGSVAEIGERELVLREIDPCAEWAQGTTRIRFDAITRIESGGAYEQALALVAAARGHAG
jgi:hypothetical protein